MAEYRPKLPSDYDRELLAAIVAFNNSVDLEEGSVERQLSLGVARVLAKFDARLSAIARSHGLDTRGRYLDDVVAQIMAGRAISRKVASAASGNAMQFTRSSDVGTLVVPAGAKVRSSADSTVEYITTQTITFAPGQTVYPVSGGTPIAVTCTKLGSIGNARSGTVRTIVQGGGLPDDIVSVTNIESIGGGQDEERDESLIQRAKMLLAGIGRSSPAGLRSIALDYVRHASVFESSEMPGYTELVLGDPSLAGQTRAAQVTSGTAGDNGAAVLYFDGPAASEPLIAIDGVFRGLIENALPGAVVIHERGMVELLGTTLNPGQTWSIYGHQVYTGKVLEVQRLVEGSNDALDVLSYGYRAAGTRVRVRHAIEQPFSLVCRAEFAPGINRLDGEQIIRDALVEYTRTVPLGGRFLIWHAEVAIRAYPQVTNFQVVSPAADLRAASMRHTLTLQNSAISFT